MSLYNDAHPFSREHVLISHIFQNSIILTNQTFHQIMGTTSFAEFGSFVLDSHETLSKEPFLLTRMDHIARHYLPYEIER